VFKKKLLSFFVISGLLLTLLPATAAANPPAVTISYSNLTHDSVTINVTINMGTGNTLETNGAVVYFSSGADVFSSPGPRVLKTGVNSYEYLGLEPNRKYYCGVSISYTNVNSGSLIHTGTRDRHPSRQNPPVCYQGGSTGILWRTVRIYCLYC